MSDTIPHATYTSTLDLLGHKLTVHVLSDGRRIYEDTPELRALFQTLGVTITDAGITLGLSEPIEAEVLCRNCGLNPCRDTCVASFPVQGPR